LGLFCQLILAQSAILDVLQNFWPPFTIAFFRCFRDSFGICTSWRSHTWPPTANWRHTTTTLSRRFYMMRQIAIAYYA